MNITQLRETTLSAYRDRFYELAGAAPPVETEDNLLAPCISLERAQAAMDLAGVHLDHGADSGLPSAADSAMRVTAALLIHVLALTEAYMQSTEKALSWLSKPMAQLGGVSIFATVLRGTAKDLDTAEQFVLRMGEGYAL